VTDPNTEPENDWDSPWMAKSRKLLGPVAYAAVAIGVAVTIGAAVAVTHTRSSERPVHSNHPVRYFGVYEPGAPSSYAGIDQFAQAIGRQPNIVSYYSVWFKPFQTRFAASAEKRGALTFVQINARGISLASIASGQYDHYLRSYADTVKAFGAPVILSFDHEMNGSWYSWGYRRSSPAEFVAAWRHIVTIFREQGASNVTWLWQINIIDTSDNHVARPAAWWPGSSYVNWVGIDGYYYGPSVTFAQLFGPTIVAVRELTRDPILIAETGAARAAGQSAKILDLFAGVRDFGLLGFVLFDQDGVRADQSWRLNNPLAYAAIRRATKTYMRPAS
jgi:mannan endo-1,4-beta-mannosidase